MTVIAVLLDPPRDGLVLPELPETSPLDASEATSLYRAMAADAMFAAADSGGELLVNYRPDDRIPDEHVPAAADAEREVSDLVADALDEDAREDARIEVQVGSTPAARVGNTVTHLLDREDATSAAVLHPDAPLVRRKDVDSAAMKLRRSPVVLGPSQGGRVHFAGFTDPIDFTDADEPPELESLTVRAIDAGYETDFLPHATRVRTGDDLATVVSIIRSRRAAERIVPAHTTARIEELGLRVDDDRTLVRD
jgi:glycosyltransferase A (GT-A) superfamily protein (DUF2064 family)